VGTLLVFSQTLSFEFFDTTCGILNRTTEQKMHRLVLLVDLRRNPTTKSKITVTTSALDIVITTFVLANGKKPPDAEKIYSTVCMYR
jgi:hypothetical protein